VEDIIINEMGTRASVYNSINKIMPFGIEKNIKAIATDYVIMKYIETNKVVGDKMYQCNHLSVFGTDYKREHP
jgi:hypothetical protein